MLLLTPQEPPERWCGPAEAQLLVFSVEALARRVTAGQPAGDDALMRRLARGDTDAVNALYARYGRPIWSYVVEIVGDRELAEEIVQDTFVAAWRQAGRFEGRSSVASWLFGIARRQARDRLRRKTAQTDPVEALEALPSDQGLPEVEAIAAASRDEVRIALERLVPDHREVLLLAFAYELSGPEIAAVIGIPEGTVKSRLFAARRALRSELEARDAK